MHPSAENRLLVCIADGAGGYPDGLKASRTACETAMRFCHDRSWQELLIPSTWDWIFRETDSVVGNVCDGRTALLTFALDKSSLTGGSVGDSKLFFHDGLSILDLTERQKIKPVIGAGSGFATFFHCENPNGRVYAMTDGVWKYCGFKQIEGSINIPIETVPGKLRQNCELKSGELPDDFSIIAVTMEEGTS